ncbi:DUF4139 domain-containing protein [Paraliomyxa miuraensis]|uniref:DUF4139 domain-containing protein n=1 Tax=Paraliomyxa miuraensis TaxID=376150 RepID=UPI00225736EB|nr:DUF4139 domain-containing protein [Paraliomyxa miuraensis]MCX4241535.1 DUF4139 domain-containing protein [Paraliomyxa miuraensis]
MRNRKLARLGPLTLLLALAPTLASTGCASGRRAFPATSTNLELERVVLYRNGVGYFERHGEVDDSTLRIRVRRDQINDLLKSLTVVDANGQAVSVSMPLDPETWAAAALSALTPGSGSLAQLLDGLRGTDVTLHTTLGRVRGRVVLVERIIDEPDPDAASGWPRGGGGGDGPSQRDFKVTLMRGNELQVVRLSKVRDVTLHDGDLAMQLHRRLDASSGEGMFQQVEVAIELVGAKSHDVSVSYVVSAPMWKPTYRVVLPEDGKGQALLQGWAVVDNVSGEDWSNVSMSLTSGEPIAFQYDLHTPRTVFRSDLTESGVRKRATVAMGETTYGTYDEAMAEPEPEAAAAYDYEADDMAGGDGDYWAEAEEEREYKADKNAKAKRKPAEPKPSGAPSSGYGRASAASGPMPPPAANAPSPVDLEALRRSTLADARAKQVSGMTRYDLEQRVTVPNGSATMVAILNRQVEAEQTFLYRPGGAGIGYDANPYRVVRFKNSTPFVLEPGPISIYTGGSFVGEGLSEAVSTGTSATIPFAVEPGIMVSSSAQYSGDEMHLLRISRGVLEVESFSRTTTTWSVKGKTDKDGYNVLVRHGKAGWNYELIDPPKGTEVLPDGYLIPVDVPKGKTEGSTVVVEQTPSTTTISIWDGRALGLMEKLVLSAELPADMRSKIQPVVDLRREIGRIDTEIDGLKAQQIELDQRANETRQNLEAIKKDPKADALRKKLSDRLEDFTSEGDRIGRKVVELQSQRLEKKIALEDLLENLDISAPPRSPSRDKSGPSKGK